MSSTNAKYRDDAYNFAPVTQQKTPPVFTRGVSNYKP
jgi:hypothetical protein